MAHTVATDTVRSVSGPFHSMQKKLKKKKTINDRTTTAKTAEEMNNYA